MRAIAAALALLALSLGAAAQQRQYAILSLVGDELMIVQREMSVGSRLDTNARQSVSLPDANIDRAMLLAVDDAVRRAEPNAKPVMLISRDPKVYAAATRSLDGGGTAAVFEAVKPIVAGAKATHLILVSKHRHRAMLRLRDGHVGSGYLEGVGFYLDHGSTARSIDRNEAERGFISPYTYFKVSVIDLARGSVVAEDYVIGSKAHTVAVGSIGNAWTALTAQEKDRQLTELIRAETARVVPKVLAQK